MIYPAHLQTEPEGGYTVTFRDVPEAITCGDTVEEALHMAADALASGLSFYAEDGQAPPKASAPKPGERLVFVSALIQAKLALIARMAELELSKVELAERLGVDEKAVRRLLNLNHESKISKIETALALLGKRLGVTVDEAS